MPTRKMNTTPLQPRDIVALARSWIGTPYHHQASRKGVGTDCLGLVRGVFREAYGFEAEAPPAYSRDWAEVSQQETLLNGARRHLLAVPSRDVRAGHVLLFRIKSSSVAKHTAIATSSTTMVHAMEGVRACEIAISPWWRRRIAGVFTFPGVDA